MHFVETYSTFLEAHMLIATHHHLIRTNFHIQTIALQVNLLAQVTFHHPQPVDDALGHWLGSRGLPQSSAASSISGLICMPGKRWVGMQSGTSWRKGQNGFFWAQAAWKQRRRELVDTRSQPSHGSRRESTSTSSICHWSFPMIITSWSDQKDKAVGFLHHWLKLSCH